MTLEKVTAILEGAFPDTPSRIQYAFIGREFPENATVLLTGSLPVRMIKYGEVKEIWDPRSFRRCDLPEPDIKGIRVEPALQWVFDMPRGLLTHKGSLYLNECHFEKGFDYYLSCVDTIIKDGAAFFRGALSPEELLSRSPRAF